MTKDNAVVLSPKVIAWLERKAEEAEKLEKQKETRIQLDPKKLLTEDEIQLIKSQVNSLMHSMKKVTVVYNYLNECYDKAYHDTDKNKFIKELQRIELLFQKLIDIFETLNFN